ncbi:MAG: SDR family oxidoreductase [Hyphomicrobiaceae bacterium]
MSNLAIVTGAAGGIGLTVARLFAERGCHVLMSDIDQDRLEAASIGLVSAGHSITTMVADIAKRTGCEALVERAAGLGNLTILAHVAGDYTKAAIAELDDATWDRMLDINLRSTLHLMRAAADRMAATGGGQIVNFASIDAYRAMPTLAHYAAAKAGVVSLTRSFAAEYGPKGVLINAVAPGPVATERAKREGWLAKYIPDTPLRRSAEPEDIAEVAWFLVSPANRCITGETVVASCGLVMV